MIRKLASLLILIFTASVAHAQSYSTNFPATENPISQGGNWLNGAANGLDWGNVQTTPGLAFGTTVSGGPPYNDSVAALTGSWPTSQSACATVAINASFPNRNSGPHEVELHLHRTITAHSSTGYEFNYGLGTDNTSGFKYAGTVRWNGALNNFTGLGGPTGTPPVLNNGDVFCATASAAGVLTATVTRAGTTIVTWTFTDTTYTNGSPGIGMYNQFGAGDNPLYGFSSFTTPSTGGPATYTASSCNQGDVNEVINGTGGTTPPIVPHNAIDGDIINIPAGSCTWTGGVSVASGIGIQIIGAGTPNTNMVCTPTVTTGCGAGTPTTTITGGGFAMAPRFGNSLSRLSTINFNPPGLPLTIQGTCTASGCPNVRVDNLVLPSSWAGVNSDNNTNVFSNVWGVVDHNTVGDNTARSTYVLLANIGHGAWKGIGDYGDNSWASADTFGTTQLINLQNNKLFPNAVGTDTDFPCCSAPGTNFGGGRYVCEFNQFISVNTTSGACPNHGTDTTGRPRGARHLEALYNFGATAANNSLWGARSATGRLFGNSFTGSAGSLSTYVNVDAQRRWRPDVYGSCDGTGPFDTNDGVNYYPGGSGNSTMATVTGGYIIGVSGTPWTLNEWLSYGTPYSMHDLDVSGGAGIEIASNTTSTLNTPSPGYAPPNSQGTIPVAGNRFQILRATVCLDQPGRGAGALLQGSNTAPVLASTNLPGPVNQALDPWYEAADTSATNSPIGSNTGSLIDNRDYYMESPNQVAQTGPTFPFTGAALSQAVSSYSCSGGGNCVITVSSTTGWAMNNFVLFAGTAPNIQGAMSGGVLVSVNGWYKITNLSPTQFTVTNTSGFTVSAAAGGIAQTIGIGHGTLANRPSTCTTGVGYWTTDQGAWNMSGGTSQGVLSTCVSTNTWSTSYTPACYPSPLIAGSPCSGASPAPIASLTPGSLTFPNTLVGSSSATQNLTLSNSGTAALLITSIAPGGTNPTDFSQTNTCGSSVAVGGSCTIAVTFKPLSAASFSATIVVTDNASGSPHTSTLTGTGVTATAGVSFAPTSLTFAPQTVGTSSAPSIVTLTNTGSGTLTVTGVQVTTGNSSSFSQTNNCTSVNPSSTCAINVVFTPQLAGALASQVCVSDNAPASPQCFAISGTGNTVGNLNFAPASLTFPNTAVGVSSAGIVVTATNSGGSAITVTSIAIGGTNNGDFSQTNNCGASIAAGGSCQVTAKFTPTTTGVRNANVTFTDTAPGSPQTVSLQGTGFTPAPVVSLSVNSAAFGNQTVGTQSNNQVVILTNTGTASLTISTATLSGANPGDYGFSTTCGGSLAVGISCTYSIHFTPTTGGSRSANFNVNTNAASTPDVVTLTGTGVASPPGAPAPQVFGE